MGVHKWYDAIFCEIRVYGKNPHEFNNHQTFLGPIRHEKESNSVDKVWCKLEICQNFNPDFFIKVDEESYGGRSLSYINLCSQFTEKINSLRDSGSTFSTLILVYLLCDVCNHKRSYISWIFFGSFATLGRVQQSCILTLRRLMSYIYGAPILDVSRSHTTTQHSR